MSIIIDDIEFDIEEEDLPYIDYLEILSFDEIIKNNPTFIAYSKDELYNELYSILKIKNKSDNFLNLFYNTIDNNKPNYNNYVIKSDAIKKDFEDPRVIQNFYNKIKEFNKLQYSLSQEEKDKLFYSIIYDNKSNKLRFKPEFKTTIELNDKYNTEYIVYKKDEANLPISSLYYKVPLSNVNDFLSIKIMSKIYDIKKLNHTNSENFKSIEKLFNFVKPDIDEAIKLIDIHPDYYNLDYSDLNSILESYNISLDFIKKDDFERLKDVMIKITEKLKEQKYIYKKVKITEHKLEDNRLKFYDKLKSIVNLITISDILEKTYDELLVKLQEQKYTLNVPPLLYDNINDIVDNINNNNITLDEVIDNIKNIKTVLTLDHSINTLNNLKENDKEEIIELLEKTTERFKLLKNAIYEKSNLKFINFYEELKEIKEGNNTDEYEGIPDIINNQEFEDLDNNDNTDIQIINVEKLSENLLEKYWLNIKYRDENGFIEMLKIILPLINKIKELSGLPLNLELLCDELFKKFRSIPTKLHIIKTKILDNNKKINDTILNKLSRYTPKYIINNAENLKQDTIEDNIYNELLEGNTQFVELFNNVFYNSLSFWSLSIQDDINKEILLYNEDLLYIPYIDRFTITEGNPIEQKVNKKGILSYLSLISNDVFIDLEKDDNMIPDNILVNCMKIIETDYKDIIKRLRDEFNSNEKMKKKETMGKLAQIKLVESIKSKKYDKLLNEYINALLYMPGVKFKKIHKYLLGCCLQRIDKNFIPDSDLKDVRNDLLAVKKKYANIRYTNEERKELFIYEKKIEIKDIEDYILPNIEKDEIKTDKDKNKELDEWLIYMKENKNNLIPKNKLEDINELNDHIKNNINIFSKTAGYNNKNLLEFFDTSKDIYTEKLNIKSILLSVSSILNLYIKNNYNDDDNDTEEDEKMIIESSIKNIKEFLDENNKLNILMCESTRVNIILIKTYIISRVLCYPCNVDNSIGNILKPSVKTSEDFIKNISKNIYDDILKSFKYNYMPTIEDNLKFINTIREQNKNKTLSIMNKKTQEQRDEINALKKFGITNTEINDNNDTEYNDNVNEFLYPDNDNDNEGEKEFRMSPEENEFEDGNDLDDY